MGEFIIKRTETGFVFHLRSVNKRTIGISQVYTTMGACKNGIDSVRRNCRSHTENHLTDYAVVANPKYEMYMDKGGEYRFRLKASNGENILASHGYKSKSGCLNGIMSVGNNAPGAAITDLTKETVSIKEAYEDDEGMEFAGTPVKEETSYDEPEGGGAADTEPTGDDTFEPADDEEARKEKERAEWSKDSAAAGWSEDAAEADAEEHEFIEIAEERLPEEPPSDDGEIPAEYADIPEEPVTEEVAEEPSEESAEEELPEEQPGEEEPETAAEPADTGSCTAAEMPSAADESEGYAEPAEEPAEDTEEPSSDAEGRSCEAEGAAEGSAERPEERDVSDGGEDMPDAAESVTDGTCGIPEKKKGVYRRATIFGLLRGLKRKRKKKTE